MARIIVIDDHAGVRVAVRAALEPVGHEVLEASEGDMGLKLLAVSGADLVITDVFMPRQDGIDVVRRIRKEFPAVKVIAISGGDASGRMDLGKEMVQLGAAKSLAKPFTAVELVKAVGEVLEGR
ncbi:MAG TPA: response regulator [Gemmatimonadales bacterium]|nr:response regulator [Gemmatimonadales bacterium]